MSETAPLPPSAAEIYAAPKSEPQTTGERPEPAFYVVSRAKFWILFLATSGIYQAYWFFKHWKTIRKATGEQLWPLPRAIFCIFFTHSLFARFSGTASGGIPASRHSLQSKATLFVVLLVADRIASRLALKDIGSPITDLISIAILPLAGWCLFKAQQAANSACGDPTGSGNSRITAANILWMAVGALVWLLILFGLLISFGVLSVE